MSLTLKYLILNFCFLALISNTSCGQENINEITDDNIDAPEEKEIPGEENRADLYGEEVVRISTKDAKYFSTEDGETWVPVMINYIAEKLPSAEEEAFEEIESYFRNFSENGGNAMRIWTSSHWLEVEDETPGDYNLKKFGRIDRLVDLAEKYQIKIKFTLQHIKTIGPGDLWSNNSVLAVENGGPFENAMEYVNTEEGKEYYLRRAKAFSERYKDSKHIFGWELWNEMDAVKDINEEVWLSWTSEMLDTVKAMFPNHLVTQSFGSVHSEHAEEMYREVFKIKNNEYVSLHRYLDPGKDWGQYAEVTQPIDLLVYDLVEFAKNHVENRPILVNEMGAVEANHIGPSQLYSIDEEGVLIHDMIFAPFFSGAAGTGGLWHWNDYIQPQNLWYHFDRFNKAIENIDPAEEGFEPFTITKNGVRSFGLKGESKAILWCRDTANNWETELAQNIPAEPKENFSIQLKDVGGFSFTAAKFYDPWKDQWTDLEIKNNVITLPTFTRSSVVKLEY